MLRLLCLATLLGAASSAAPVATLMLSSPLLQATGGEQVPASGIDDAADMILRAMGLPAHVSSSAPAALPATDLFTRPRIGVMFVVDAAGVNSTGQHVVPLLQSGAAGSVESVLQPIASRVNGLPLLSGDHEAAASACPACAKLNVAPPADVVQGVRDLWHDISSAAQATQDSLPEIEALINEMAMFKQLPAHVRASSSLKDDVPDLFVLSATAPQRLRAAHGDDAPLSMAASALLSSIMSEVQDSFESISPGRVLHQVLMTHDGGMAAHSSAHQQRRAGRHLLAATSVAAGEDVVQYTSDQISMYQIKLWTMVVLVLMSLATCWGFIAMDTPLDPMLRVKVKHDDKTD